MSDIQGINIAAPVVPYTTDDIYPTHYAIYGKGGWRTVLSIADRNNIPLNRLEVGMIVSVLDTGAGLRKRYELISLSGATATWQELVIAGSSTWGNISGNVPDQLDLVSHLHLNYVSNNREFAAGNYAVGETFSVANKTFTTNTAVTIPTSAFTTHSGNEVAIFTDYESNFSLILQKKNRQETTITTGGTASLMIDASLYTDSYIVLAPAVNTGPVNISVDCTNVLIGGQLNIYITCSNKDSIVFSSAFLNQPSLPFDATVSGPQTFAISYIVDRNHKLVQLGSAGSSYNKNTLRGDFISLANSAQNSTVNIIASDTSGISIQTAAKDWTPSGVYSINSIIKYKGLLFRSLAEIVGTQYLKFEDSYSSGNWDYLGPANTYKSLTVVSSPTLSWDWKNTTTLNVTSDSTNTTTSITMADASVFTGVEIILWYKRTTSQVLTFDPIYFDGTVKFAAWAGTTQNLFFKFRSVPYSTKFVYVESGAVSGDSVLQFNGVFSGLTVNLPVGTKSVLTFSVDYYATINPADYTLDLVSAQPTLTLKAGKFSQISNGDNYWGNSIITAASLNAIQSVRSVQGMTGNVTITPASIGLAAVAVSGNYSDLSGVPTLVLPLTAMETANYALALTDLGKVIPVYTNTTLNLTIPKDSTTLFPIGAYIYVRQKGTGPVSIVGEVGVTILALNSALRTPGQNGEVRLHKEAANTWVITGGIV